MAYTIVINIFPILGIVYLYILNPFSFRETISLKDSLFFVDAAGGVFLLGGARQGRGGRTGGGAQHQERVPARTPPPPPNNFLAIPNHIEYV